MTKVCILSLPMHPAVRQDVIACSSRCIVEYNGTKADQMQKHSSGLTAMTERTLGAKAGHLELLKGGKKNKDGKDAKDAKGKPIEIKKGGSKKFG